MANDINQLCELKITETVEDYLLMFVVTSDVIHDDNEWLHTMVIIITIN